MEALGVPLFAESSIDLGNDFISVARGSSRRDGGQRVACGAERKQARPQRQETAHDETDEEEVSCPHKRLRQELRLTILPGSRANVSEIMEMVRRIRG
jgi:hypothetical protein